MSPGRGGSFLVQTVSIPLSPLCSRNWPCRSNSPRRWRPASCPTRSPLRPLPSVPCLGPWPSGLPPQQPPPSSQLPFWAQLCFVPQQEPSVLPRGPSSLPPTRLPGEARAHFPAVSVPISSSQDACFLHPQETAFYNRGLPAQPRKSWGSFKGTYPLPSLD